MPCSWEFCPGDKDLRVRDQGRRQSEVIRDANVMQAFSTEWRLEQSDCCFDSQFDCTLNEKSHVNVSFAARTPRISKWSGRETNMHKSEQVRTYIKDGGYKSKTLVGWFLMLEGGKSTPKVMKWNWKFYINSNQNVKFNSLLNELNKELNKEEISAEEKLSCHVRRLHGSLTTQYPKVIIGCNCCDALRALAADVLQ